jgi:hypothetical protein
VTPAARTLLLSQEYSPRWRADLPGGTRTAPAPSFGWATAFSLGGAGERPVRVIWHGQAFHRLTLLLQLAMVIAIGAAWSRRAARDRGER